MQHNSYRHLGFFSSKHLSGVFYTSKKTGEKLKSTTYNFGVDLIWVRYWIFNFWILWCATPCHKK
jgi:hypothetical protein